MFGYHPPREMIYQIISKIDKNESGGIGFEEFLKIMTDNIWPCDEDNEDDFENVFNFFDLK